MTCGSGEQRRLVQCQHGRALIAPRLCPAESKPHIVKTCQMKPCPTLSPAPGVLGYRSAATVRATWISGEWTEVGLETNPS